MWANLIEEEIPSTHLQCGGLVEAPGTQFNANLIND